MCRSPLAALPASIVKSVVMRLGVLAGKRLLLAILASLLAFSWAHQAQACRLIVFRFLPTDKLQIVIWLEDAQGNFVRDLTRERLSCRWAIGRLGYARSLPTPAIDSVRVELSSNIRHNPRRRGRGHGNRSGDSDSRACVVRAGGRMLPIRFMQEEHVVQYVARLLRTNLDELGHPLHDV